MLALLGLASARDVVLYQGDPAVALTAAAAALGDTTSVVPVRLIELPGGDAPTVLGAPVSFCRSETVGNAAVRDQMSRAEGHLAYQRTAEARVVLDGAVTALDCLPEPIEASLAGRLFFLRGVVALREGDAAGAERAFRHAAAFQPGLPWDPRFPPDPTGTFARATVPSSSSVVVPVGLGPGSSVWVDGRAPSAGATLSLVPGTHYLQILDNGRAHTAVVKVSADQPIAVVAPGWLAAVDLDRLDDATRRSLAELARRAFPGDTLYAVAGGRVYAVDTTWRVQPGRSPGSAVCGEMRRYVGVGLLGGGAGLFAGGAVVFGVAQARVATLAPSPDGETAEAYAQRVGAQSEAAGMLPIGGVVAGVGVALGVVGLVLELPAGSSVRWTGTGAQIGWVF